MIVRLSQLDDTTGTLTLADGQEVRVPISELPVGAAVGQEIELTFGGNDRDERVQAKALLNEILHPSTL